MEHLEVVEREVAHDCGRHQQPEQGLREPPAAPERPHAHQPEAAEHERGRDQLREMAAQHERRVRPAQLAQRRPQRVAHGEGMKREGHGRGMEGGASAQRRLPGLGPRAVQPGPVPGPRDLRRPRCQQQREREGGNHHDSEPPQPAPRLTQPPAQVQGREQGEGQVREQPGPHRHHAARHAACGEPPAQAEQREGAPGGAEHEQRVVPRLLRVPDEERRAGGEPGRGYGRRAPKPALREPRGHRHQRGAEQRRGQAERPFAVPGQRAPQVQHQAVERPVHVLEQLAQHETASDVGAVPGERLVDPQALGAEAEQAQERRRQGGGDQTPVEGRIGGGDEG